MMMKSGAQILVAEDGPSQSAVLRPHFADAGVTVSTVRDGVAALSALDDGDVAVVVADVDMPVMGGHELCRAVRERRLGVPVVLVGEADALGPFRAMASGAAAFLSTPYEPAELVDCVREALGEVAGAAAPRALAHGAVAGLDAEGLVQLLVAAVDAEALAIERARSLGRELARDPDRHSQVVDQLRREAVLHGDDPRNEAVSYIVHELRSPLSVVSGYAGLLSETEPVEERRGWIDAIVRSAAEIAQRLDDLADTQDVFRGGLELRPEVHDVGELVRTIVHDLSPQLQPHDVDLTVPPAVHATIDRGRLGQALGNLLTNAAKFSPADAPIDVGVSADDQVVTISVRDRGCGVPEHRRAELFRRFSRLGSRAKGMGIGLYLARSIVEAHGGVLRYDPAPGGGSVFSIQLPQVPAVAEEPEGTPAEATTPASHEHGPITVLCVEDDRANVTLIERMLDGRVADVLAAADRATGLELARLRRPDVVLLDLQLGEESGLDVLHELRTDIRTASIPVVILSGAVNADSVSQLRAYGATAVLAKPVGVDELRRTVDEAVAGSSAPERAARGGGPDQAIERRPEPGIDTPAVDEALDLRFVEALLDLGDASDDEGGMVALVRAMLADAHTNLKGLEAAVRAGDAAAAARIAHSLRGGLANLGAQVVARHCHDLETTARTGADTDLEPAYRLVAAALDDAEAALWERFSIKRS